MSIYSLLAFNAAHDQVQKNIADSQAIDAKRIQNQTDQEALDLNKKLDLAKVSQANNENTLNNYVGDQLKDNINKQYKAKQDQLDAVSGLQDIAQHKAQQGAQQASQVASHLVTTDPDVQAHVSTLMGIMGTQGNSDSSVPSAASTVMPNLTAGNTGGSPSAPSAIAGGTGPDGARIPSIFPMTGQMPSPLQTPQQIQTPGVASVQGGASPQNVNAQVNPQVGSPTPDTSVSTPIPQQAAPQAQQPTGTQGIDLSPVEQAFGMPKGSMWLNPATMKPEVSPIFTNRMEAANRAQANHDVNQQNYEDSREDRNVRTASTLMANAAKTGPIGVQNGKVDQAIHARSLINSTYDPQTGQYNVTQVPYGELGETLSSLLAGKVGSSDARVAAVKQKTAQGDLNTFLSYWNGKPSNATSQDAIKQTVDIIDRQGQVAEKERDDAFNKLKNLPIFKRLNDDDFESVKSMNIGNSFTDTLKNSPDKQAQQNQGQSGQANDFKEGAQTIYNGRTVKIINGKPYYIN